MSDPHRSRGGRQPIDESNAHGLALVMAGSAAMAVAAILGVLGIVAGRW